MEINIRKCKKCGGTLGVTGAALKKWKGVCSHCRAGKPISESPSRGTRIPKRIKGSPPLVGYDW